MGVILWLAKWVFGPVIALTVTLVLSEPLKNWLAPLISKMGSKKEDGISGTWTATFFYGPDEKEYVERLELSTFLGQIVGHIVPYENNHSAVKAVEEKRPLRLRGSIKDNRFFTGVWFHPNRESHHHGAFKLLIDTNNKKIRGMWLGYSERMNIIESGKWNWRREK